MVNLKERKIDETIVRKKRQQLEEAELSLDLVNLSIEQVERELRLKILERKAKSDLRNFKEQKERLEGNIQVLKKQIRTKTEKYLPENNEKLNKRR